jgi:hypothetical protein
VRRGVKGWKEFDVGSIELEWLEKKKVQILVNYDLRFAMEEQKISRIPNLPSRTRGTIPWETYHSSRALLNIARIYVHTYIKITFT